MSIWFSLLLRLSHLFLPVKPCPIFAEVKTKGGGLIVPVPNRTTNIYPYLNVSLITHMTASEPILILGGFNMVLAHIFSWLSLFDRVAVLCSSHSLVFSLCLVFPYLLYALCQKASMPFALPHSGQSVGTQKTEQVCVFLNRSFCYPSSNIATIYKKTSVFSKFKTSLF